MSFLKKRTPGSMFKRLFVIVTAAVLFCVSVAGVSMLLFFMNFWKDGRLERLSDEAQRLAHSVSALYESEGAAAQSAFRALPLNMLESVAEPSDFDIFVVDADGKIVLCRENVGIYGDIVSTELPCALHAGYAFPRVFLEEAAAAAPEPYLYEGVLEGYPGSVSGANARYYAAATALRVKNGDYLGAVITVQLQATAYLPYATEVVRMLFITGLVAVFAAFVVAMFVSYRMSRPMKTIIAATKKYAAGDFSERIREKDSYSELADLADSFNSMAESLANIDTSRSAFVANISHELKTPMTIISGFIDGILDHTIPEEETEKYLRIVSDETKRLSRLVVAMLNLSRIEAGKSAPALTEISLPEMIYDNLLGFERKIRERSIEIEGLDTLEDVTVRADETLFNQIVYNLIDNAVKFTPEGGAISFSLVTEKKNAVLRIRNEGRGIPPEECSLIFDRFYKVDKSRGLDAGSFGIGLYIVKSIVEMHGGTISVNSDAQTYTEFVIKLPIR